VILGLRQLEITPAFRVTRVRVLVVPQPRER